MNGLQYSKVNVTLSPTVKNLLSLWKHESMQPCVACQYMTTIKGHECFCLDCA